MSENHSNDILSEQSMKKQPPRQQVKSLQLDLFSQFLTNDSNAVSNTIEVWECIPKYFFTTAQTEKLRNEDGYAVPFKWDFNFHDQPCVVRIQPALIEEENGTYKAHFPGVTEELIEEALKKILTEQRNAFHSREISETWIRFSLRMIQKELKAKGKDRNIKQIKHAVEVMSSCVITLTKSGKEVWKGAILQDLVTVDREEYLADTNAHHMARLPLFISYGINTLSYRQFNYNRLMACKEQLSRWIHKLLVNRFRQASMTTTYHFMYTTLKTSGFLQQKNENGNRRKVIGALDELVSLGAIKSYRLDSQLEGRKIVNIKYTITPTAAFAAEQKASNKRQKDSVEDARNHGVQLVDKSL